MPSAPPFQCMTTSRGSLALPCDDRQQRAEAVLRQLGRAQHVDLDAERGERTAALGHLGGIEHVGRLADQVAGELGAGGDAFQRRPCGLGPRRCRRSARGGCRGGVWRPRPPWCGSGRSGSRRRRAPRAACAAWLAGMPSTAMAATGSRATAAAARPPASSMPRSVCLSLLPRPTSTTRCSPAPGARIVQVCPFLPVNSAAAAARAIAPPQAASAAAHSPAGSARSCDRRTSAPSLGQRRTGRIRSKPCFSLRLGSRTIATLARRGYTGAWTIMRCSSWPPISPSAPAC